MLTTGIIISYLLGFSLLNTISYKFSILEKIGLSFLLGIVAQTFLMLGMDSIGITLTGFNNLLAGFLFIVILNIKTIKQRTAIVDSLKAWRFKIPDINFICLLFIAIIIYLEYMNLVKCLYYPTFDRDSIAGAETIGWIIAQEGTLKNLSVFQSSYNPAINGPGSYITYAPMLQLSYAYVYSLGAETSKIIPALVYMNLLISFYAVIYRFIGNTGAAVATFFMMITPEMIAFSSLSWINVIHATYASLGVIYTVLWFKKRESYFFILGAVLLGCSVWIRNESVVFIGAILVIMFIEGWETKKFKDLIIFGLTAISPLLIWSIYMKIFGFYAEGVLIIKPYWDANKATIIWSHFKMLITNRQYYGLSFIAFAIMLLLNILNIIKRKDMINLIGIIFLAMSFYLLIIYQIEYKWDSIENVLSYSVKRFMFCFIPLLWLYIIGNQWGTLLFQKLDSYLSFKKKS